VIFFAIVASIINAVDIAREKAFSFLAPSLQQLKESLMIAKDTCRGM